MTARVIAVFVAVAVLAGGPLAPMAVAQQPAQPAPGLYQERLKPSPRAEEEAVAYEAGATIVNVFHAPGKAVLCGIGSAVGVAMLILTFGSGYKAAAGIAREGCGGKWVVTGDDLRSDWPTHEGQ